LRDCRKAEEGERPFRKRVKSALALAFAFSLLIGAATAGAMGGGEDEQERVRLGARLFREDRFSSREGDLVSSCSHCHLFSESPEGPHAFTDSFARSWIPWRTGDPRREALRNAPTLFDVGIMPRLHFDGEFESLEDLVRGTLTGRTFGWLPGERPRALWQIRTAVLNDAGGATMPGVAVNPDAPPADSYRAQFQRAYAADLRDLAESEVLDLVARAISEYMRQLKSGRTSPYDRFVVANGLPVGPGPDEAPVAFARRMLGRIADLEAKRKLKVDRRGGGFDADALAGMKLFFGSGGARGAPASGNCVSCHAPPLFTDLSFHNIGVTQREYDRVHGEGAFAALEVPDAEQAARPSLQFREAISSGRPGNVDLGYWNFIKLGDSPLRRAGESDTRLLRRMIGAFKTPTLRNLAYSGPYMHNGLLPSLESALTELVTLSRLARSGRVRQADDELALITIGDGDIRPLVSFLNALNEDLKARIAGP